MQRKPDGKNTVTFRLPQLFKDSNFHECVTFALLSGIPRTFSIEKSCGRSSHRRELDPHLWLGVHPEAHRRGCAARPRDLDDDSPRVIFIHEIDSTGGKRGFGSKGDKK
jgi:hypothetical protein